MGRHSGFIACYAALANHEADFVLIPEVPFAPRRPQRVPGHAAPAGQGPGECGRRGGRGRRPGDHAQAPPSTDASGNARLGDIGLHLKAEITEHFAGQGSPLT